VDFWDLTKVLVRRWYLALPGLGLTAVAALGMLATVQPKYIATSYVQVAPPVARPTQPGEPSLEQRNPWMGLGPDTLADTAMLTVQQPAVLESLVAAGFSAVFTATLSEDSPLVTFEVTAGTREQATASTNEIIRRFSASVLDLQVEVYGVTEQDLATVERIDIGNNITESNSNVIRAAVAVTGIGLLLTFALAIGVDALVSRRARRRSGGSAGVGVEDLSPPPTGPVPARAATATARTPFASVPALPSAEPTAAAVSWPTSGSASTPNGVPGGLLEEAHGNGATVPQRVPAATDAVTDEAHSEPAPAAVAPPDETLTLPLAYRAPRRRQAKDRGAGLR
jgi:hypothetical protein